MNRGNKDKLSIGNRFFSALNNRGLLLWVPDKYVLKKLFKIKTGKKLDLKNPKTYGEKVQWLKLYNRKPEYVMMVDKLKVKEYVAQTIGKQYVIPVITVWESVDEINWDTLPNQFVLKCNHDQGGIVICRNKKELNKNKAKQILHQHMKRSGYWYGREWPYKDVDRKIFAEIYREDCTGELLDYKVLCFGGKAKLIEVHAGRFSDSHSQTFYDIDWKKKTVTISRNLQYTAQKGVYVATPKNGKSRSVDIGDERRGGKALRALRLHYYQRTFLMLELIGIMMENNYSLVN